MNFGNIGNNIKIYPLEEKNNSLYQKEIEHTTTSLIDLCVTCLVTLPKSCERSACLIKQNVGPEQGLRIPEQGLRSPEQGARSKEQGLRIT